MIIIVCFSDSQHIVGVWFPDLRKAGFFPRRDALASQSNAKMASMGSPPDMNASVYSSRNTFGFQGNSILPLLLPTNPTLAVLSFHARCSRGVTVQVRIYSREAGWCVLRHAWACISVRLFPIPRRCALRHSTLFACLPSNPTLFIRNP